MEKQQQDLKELQKRFGAEQEFFKQFEQSFIDNFAKFMYLAKPGLLSVAALKTFGVKVYNLLFSFDKDPSMELYNFCFKLAENEINLRPILTKSLLEITKGYIDYMIQKNENIENLKEMISLIDCYMMMIDKANMDYVELLSGELKKAKQERKNEQSEIILHGLKSILAKKLEIELIDYYKQIPVACKAKIASLSDEIIEIDISTCSTKIFGIEKTVYIKSQTFPKPVKASIIKSDQKKETIQAADFEFTELPQEKRRFVRVQPKNPVEIRLKKNLSEANGYLADISVGGTGVYMTQIFDLRIGDTVEAHFGLSSKSVQAEGIIRHIVPMKGSYKIGIELFIDNKTEEVISEYIMERQFEILKELRNI